MRYRSGEDLGLDMHTDDSERATGKKSSEVGPNGGEKVGNWIGFGFIYIYIYLFGFC